MKIILPNERPISANRNNKAHHTARSAERDRVFLAMREHIIPGEHVFDVPVTIEIVAYMKHPVIDADNLVTKPYIDALTHYGVIEDDSWVHVSWCITRARLDKENPRLEINVQKAEEHGDDVR